MDLLQTYKCAPCDRDITVSNKENHENTEFHLKNLRKKACHKCEIEKEEYKFFKGKNICKSCINYYKKEKIECKKCKTLTTRNYYYKHMKKISEVINVSNNSENTISKTCTKCNINKPLDSFNNDKSKKDGKTSNCKDCRKNKILKNEENIIDVLEQSSHELSQKFKKILDLKNIECTACNVIISKTNWSKHEKTIKHIKNIECKLFNKYSNGS